MRFRLDKLDWRALREDKKLKLYIGLVVALVIFFAFCLDVIYSVYSARYYTEKMQKKTIKKQVIKKEAVLEKKAFARVAVILDDAGGSIPNYKNILSIKQPLTISVLPHLPTSSSIAKAFRDAGYEVMIHLPMEPDNGSYIRNDGGMVLCSYGEGQISETVMNDIKLVKYATGLNNHLGSKATKDEKVMRSVLSSVKGEKLFFVDSKTSSNSLALKIARELHIRSAENNIFLDGGTKEAEVEMRFGELISMARGRGSAIGIGHATRPSTINALRRLMPLYAKNGIKFVHASELVK